MHPIPRFYRSTLACACAAALWHVPSLAQSSGASLPAVTVSAQDGSGAALAPSVAGEQKRLDRVAGGTNLAQPQQEARLATLRDALDYQPGIVIQDFFGATDQPRLNIRGSGIQSNPVNRGVLLLQDGLPLNEADGSFIIGLIEPRNAALVSVRRGANALTPGATTLGGELDFQSLTGADERLQLRSEYGSFGRRALQAAVGRSGAQWDARLSASSDRFDGWRHHSGSQRQALHANLGWRGAGVENRSYVSWTDLRFDIPHVLPKERVYSDPQSVLGDASSAQDKLLNVYLRDPRRAARQLRLANRTRWGDAALHQELGMYWQSTDDFFNDSTTQFDTRSRTHGLQWQAGGALGPQLQWRTALGWAHSRMNRDLDANNPANGSALQRFGAYDLSADNLQALLAADWQLAPAWAVSGQLGASRQQRDARSRQGSAELNQHWSFATPKLGVQWTPKPQQRWWANVSRSQEAPTFWEIVSANVLPPNPASAKAELVALNLQRASTFEIGGQGRWGAGESARAPQWQITYYRSEVSDELMSTSNASGIKVGTYNYAGGTRHQGIEAGLAGSSGAWDWRGSWTYSDFRFKEGVYAGKRIAGVPRHLINAELLWRHASSSGVWRVGPNLRWMPSSTPIDHANTPGSTQDAYALLGAKLEWKNGPWGAYLLAENLTDRRYASSYAIRNQASAAMPGYLPGLGRSVAAGLSYQF